MNTTDLDGDTERLYAIWCARQVQSIHPDPYIRKALDIPERFINGSARHSELGRAVQVVEKLATRTDNRAHIWAATAVVAALTWDIQECTQAAVWAAMWNRPGSEIELQARLDDHLATLCAPSEPDPWQDILINAPQIELSRHVDRLKAGLGINI